MTELRRAYSVLEIKSIDEEHRVIEGIASTPKPDRMGDIVESMGARFALPLPLLLDHNSREQVGHVEFAKPTKNGIPFRARVQRIDEPGQAKDLVDKAWHFAKYGLRKFVSIGFRALEDGVERMAEGGYRFTSWEWLELSLVSIPAQPEAVINQLKSLDADLLAASGHKRSVIEQHIRPAPRQSSTKVVKAEEAKPMKKSYAEQISAFEATRSAKSAEMDAIMEKSADTGETLDAEQKETYDTLEREVKEVDDHLARLRAAEKRQMATAKPVNGETQEDASVSRAGSPSSSPVISVRRNVEKGIIFTRLLGAKYLAYKYGLSPIDVARAKFADTPEVEIILKAPIAALNTTDANAAGPLVNLATGEFIELLRPNTIIDRLPGVRRVPFNIKMGRGTTDPTAYWVGQGQVKPVSSMAFDSVELTFAKIAGITYQTEELMKFSAPSSERIVRDGLVAAVAYLSNRDFLDPTKASDGASPASITYGVTPVTATGTDADALRADMGSLLDEYEDDNMGDDSLVLIMTRKQAGRIGLMRNSLGNREFPDINRAGGFLEGIPVVTSNNIVATGGSPTDGGLIVAVNQSSLLLADDGEVSIDVSREASLQVDSAPDSPPSASTVLRSMWQHNEVAIKAERFINWKKARDGSVQFIQNAKYR